MLEETPVVLPEGDVRSPLPVPLVAIDEVPVRTELAFPPVPLVATERISCSKILDKLGMLPTELLKLVILL
jgi:hypothetical protein